MMQKEHAIKHPAKTLAVAGVVAFFFCISFYFFTVYQVACTVSFVSVIALIYFIYKAAVCRAEICEMYKKTLP